jgi:Tol biopolymer transport system component
MTSFGRWAGSPAWSPDSQRIAFDCNVTDAWNVYVESANGGKPTRLTSNGANNSRPSWSLDGNWIYYSSNRTGRNQIWKIGVAGKPEIQVTKNGSGLTPMVSADGQTIYYTNQGGLWKIPAAGGSEEKVLASVCDAGTSGFASTKHGIYFFDRCLPEGTLWFLDLATGSVRQLHISGHTLSVSSDERWLLYGKGAGGSDLMLVENFR